jgi:hypothetical protein
MLGSNTHRRHISAPHSRSWVLAEEAVADQMRHVFLIPRLPD